MQFRISKYPVRICCCVDNFYLFSVRYLNDVYDVDFILEQDTHLVIGENIIKINIKRFRDKYKINLVYNEVNYNFEIDDYDIGQWIDISMFY